MPHDRTREAEQSQPQTDVAPKPNYATLSADVEAWTANWIQYVRGEYGDEAAEEAASYLGVRPWLCLKWFVDDNTPKDQREELIPFL
jgi:hypothetical protein